MTALRRRKKNRKEQEEETTSIINCHTLYSIFTLKQERKVALKASQVDPQLTGVIVRNNVVSFVAIDTLNLAVCVCLDVHPSLRLNVGACTSLLAVRSLMSQPIKGITFADISTSEAAIGSASSEYLRLRR